MDNNTTTIPFDRVEKVTAGPDLLSRRGIPQLVKEIKLVLDANLSRKERKELEELKRSNGHIYILGRLRSILTIDAKSDGSFAVNESFHSLIAKAFASTDQADEDLMRLLQDAEIPFQATYSQEKFQALFEVLANKPDLKEKLREIGIVENKKPTEEALTKLVALASEESALRSLLYGEGILDVKKNFSRPERENMLESIRLLSDQKRSQNDMSIHRAINLESYLNESTQHAMSMLKTFNDTIRSINRNIRGN